jgi:hypothetical protein
VIGPQARWKTRAQTAARTSSSNVEGSGVDTREPGVTTTLSRPFELSVGGSSFRNSRVVEEEVARCTRLARGRAGESDNSANIRSAANAQMYILVFEENETQRTQEFALRWSPDGGNSLKEIVRQQWGLARASLKSLRLS